MVVGGVAVGQLVGDTGGEDEASSPAAETADDQGLPAPDRDSAAAAGDFDGTDEELPGAVSDHASLDLPAAPGRASDRPGSPVTPGPWLPARPRGEARRAGGAVRRRAGRARRPALPGRGAAAATSAVVLDGEAGWLVYRPPRGDTRVVDLFLCGTDSPERSATLPLD